MFDTSSLLSLKNIIFFIVGIFVLLFLFSLLFKKTTKEGLTPIGSSELENLVKRIKTSNITQYDSLLMDKYRDNWEDLIFVVEEGIHILLFKNLQAIGQGYINNIPDADLDKLMARGNLLNGYIDTLNKQIKYLDANVPMQK